MYPLFIRSFAFWLFVCFVLSGASQTVSFVLPASQCANAAVVATVITAPVGSTSFSWSSIPSTVITSNGSLASLSFSTCTNVTLSCFAYSSNNSLLGSSTQTFFVDCNSLSLTPLSQTVCPGTSVTITASGASSYSWSTGANTNSIVVSPFNHTVYAVYDGTSICASTASVAIFDITVTASSMSVCPNTQHTLTGTGALNYNWYLPSGVNIVNGGPTIAITPTALPATYTVVSTNGFTCLSFKQISIGLFPYAVNANVPSSVCSAKNFSLQGLSASSYTWTTPTQVYTINPLVLQQTATTTYTLNADSVGCYNTKIFNVGISPQPTITIVASQATICVNQINNLFASGAVNYTWSYAPGMLSSLYGSSVQVSPVVTTTYSLVGANAQGCVSNKQYTVFIGQYPSLNIVQSVTAVCFGYSASVVASGAYAYLWTGTGLTAPVSGATIQLNAGTYQVQASNGGTCLDSLSFSIAALPPLPVQVSASESVTCMESDGYVDPVVLNAVGAPYYTWAPYLPGQMTYSIGPSTIVTPTASTCFTVKGYNTDCMGTAIVCITSGICTGISKLELNTNIVLSPNPANNAFKIDISDEQILCIRIYNAQGLMVLKKDEPSSNINVDVLRDGYYLLVIETYQGKVFQKQLIIVHE